MRANIRDRLVYWSQAPNSQTFVKRVLEDETLDVNTATLRSSKQRIQHCFSTQAGELTKSCVPFLKKLKEQIADLHDREGRGRTNFGQLKKNIDKIIKTLNAREPFLCPPPIFNLITGYLPDYERAQIHAELTNTQAQEIAKNIQKLNENKISELVSIVVKKFFGLKKGGPLSRLSLFRLMESVLREFFLYATLDQQDYFFACISREMNQNYYEAFSQPFIECLPEKMEQLSLSWRKSGQLNIVSFYEKQQFLREKNIPLLGDRLKYLKLLRIEGAVLEVMETALSTIIHSFEQLQKLHLVNCALNSKLCEDLKNILSSQRIQGFTEINFKNTLFCQGVLEALANNPHAEALQELDLTGRNDCDISVKELAVSKCLNLKRLNLSWYKTLTDAGVMAVAKSPAMSNLAQLNLSYSQNILGGDSLVTDAAVVAIAESPYMQNIEELDLSGTCNLTDASIMAILNSPYLKKLKKVKLLDCPNISVDALWQLNHFLANNQKEEEEPANQEQIRPAGFVAFYQDIIKEG